MIIAKRPRRYGNGTSAPRHHPSKINLLILCGHGAASFHCSVLLPPLPSQPSPPQGLFKAPLLHLPVCFCSVWLRSPAASPTLRQLAANQPHQPATPNGQTPDAHTNTLTMHACSTCARNTPDTTHQARFAALIIQIVMGDSPNTLSSNVALSSPKEQRLGRSPRKNCKDDLDDQT